MQNELTTRIATQTTATLAECLLALSGQRTPESNLVHAAIIDEIANRFPEINDALDAWAEDMDTDLTIAEATVAAIPMVAL